MAIKAAEGSIKKEKQFMNKQNAKHS